MSSAYRFTGDDEASMSGDLDSILNEDEQPVAAVEPVAEPETPTEPEATPEPVAEEPSAQTRDEKGRFASKGDKAESASPAPQSVEPPLDHAALLGERRRRQEAEDRYRELEQRFAQFQQPQPRQAPQPQAAQAFEFNEDLYWSNPQQFLQGFKQSILAEVQGVIPQVVTGVTLDRAEQAARARYEDYDQARDAFYRVAVADETVARKALAQADPAEFAYQEGKRLLEMANYGSTNDYIEAEVARRISEAQKAAVPAPVIPESLAAAPAASASADVLNGPRSLDAILNSKG